MAQLKSLICKGCGAAIGLDQLERCPYCKTQNFVMGSIDPFTMETQKVQEMITFYKGKIESNAKDTNSLFALGLFYLALSNYRFAQQNLLKAIELSPMEPDVYYYYALALIAGRTPKNLDHDEAVEIEEMIKTAVGMERKRKYLALLACVEQGAFVSNGLQAKDNPNELIQEALKIMPEAGELDEIAKHAQPTDKESKRLLAMLSTGKKEQATTDTGNGAIGGITPRNVYFPSKRDSQFTQKGYDELVKSEANREDFFSNLHEPIEPDKQSKPFYPLWTIIKGTIAYFVIFVVVLIVALVSGLQDKAEDERIFEVVDANTPDSVLVQDSMFLAEHWNISYRPQEENGYGHRIEGTPDASTPRPMKVKGFNHGTGCLIYLSVIAAPILIWLIMTLWSIISCYRERKAIDRANKQAKKDYLRSVEQFKVRPTIQDYLRFCRDYLGKGVIDYGDVVTKMLSKYDIAEGNIVGKILFINTFDEYENDDEYNEYTDDLMPERVLDRIYYTIAIPQKDQLFIIQNYWETVTNQQTTPQVRTVFYGNISEVLMNPVTDQLEIHTNRDGVIAINTPSDERSNVLDYQNKNVNSSVDYSITRTGNVHEFFNALSTLIRTYQK